jgi:hypothetical protein
LQSLVNTLNRFFSVRAGGRGDASTVSSATADASSSLSRQQLISELLPADYRTDLTLNDIINEASALDLASSGGGSSGDKARSGSLKSIAPNRRGFSPGLKKGDARLPDPGLLPQQQQQPQEEEEPPQVIWDKQAVLATSSRSIQSSSKAVLRDLLVCGGEQRLMYRKAGLNQRPARPPNRECK